MFVTACTVRFSSVVSALLLTFFSSAALADEQGKVSHLLTCDKPVYQERSITNEEEGIVKLSLVVGADGKVTDASVLASSGYQSLDKASLRAVQGCSIQPGLPQAPVTLANVSFNWVLN